MKEWKKNRKWLVVLLMAGVISILLVELPLDQRPLSPVLYSADGELMAALVAEDEQWRFPRSRKLPDFLKQAIIQYEDAYFYKHPGVNPAALWKAWRANRKAGKIVRGGSTLTMQVARMARNRASRSYTQKMLEILAAFKLELRYSKGELLALWCRLASFGGNVEGIETAAWRFFGRPLNQLSRAEMATLAVLPNAPSLIHPGRNRSALRNKRNILLEKMAENGVINKDELPILTAEPLPRKPFDLPQEALHLLEYLRQRHPGEHLFETSLKSPIQKRTNRIVRRSLDQLEPKGIRSAAAMVIDIETNELLAYCGNTPDGLGRMRYVDLIHAPRSYGSLLKPFLYAFALEKGALLPKEFISDVPMHIRGFEPDNFDEKFRGAVPFDQMLIQSLNVPAVGALHYLGYRSFYDFLQTMEPAHLNRGADHYGLSLILGGGESDLWSLARLYKGLARRYQGFPDPFAELRITSQEKSEPMKVQLGDFAVDHTIRAMANLEKPRDEQGWERLRPSEDVAWKTGTSYGHRDAWTIGFNKRYLVAVWLGNEDAEGRAGLTGISVAAPLFFDIIGDLNSPGLLREFHYNNRIRSCAFTGRRAGLLCDSTIWLYVNQISHKWRNCEAHKIGVVRDNRYYPPNCLRDIQEFDTFFVLPTLEESFYKRIKSDYYVLPPIYLECRQEEDSRTLQFVYPFENASIFLPLESNSKRRSLLAQVAIGGETEQLFWYLDDQFLGTTSDTHEMACKPTPGQHKLTVVHENGQRISTDFRVSWN